MRVLVFTSWELDELRETVDPVSRSILDRAADRGRTAQELDRLLVAPQEPTLPPCASCSGCLELVDACRCDLRASVYHSFTRREET